MSTHGGTLLPLRALEPFGRDLQRPECVVIDATGEALVSDWRGGVAAIRPDGSQHGWLARAAFRLRPNGIALAPDGALLIAHLGDAGDAGGVWRLGRDGTLTPWITEVEGTALPPTNFVTHDAAGRTWISVSTRHVPRQRAWTPDVADGFIVLADARGTRIVADGLHYTNEVRPDPSGDWLYVVETFGRRLVRFPLRLDSRLGPREVVVTLGHGCFPDGFAFDDEGGIWITSLVSNRLLRLRRDGRLETVLEDVNEQFVETVEQAFAAGTMSAEHLGPVPGRLLQQVTSIAFGGSDRRTAYLGSLHATCLYRFRSAVAGAPPPHWAWGSP